MLAGKYMRGIANSPVGSAVAGGAAAAGLSALGNVGSDKPGERIAAEALGAGALGALAGSRVPTIRQITSKENVGKNLGPIMQDMLNSPEGRAASDKQKRGFVRGGEMLYNAAPAAGAAIAAGGIAAAGGLGGQVGGGAANLMGIDPENPGSSNTMGARYSMQGYV